MGRYRAARLQTASASDILPSDTPSAHLLPLPLIGTPPAHIPLPPSRAPVCVLSASASALAAVRPNERERLRTEADGEGTCADIRSGASWIPNCINHYRIREGGGGVKEQRNGISSMTGTGIMSLHTRDRESELGACVVVVALSFFPATLAQADSAEWTWGLGLREICLLWLLSAMSYWIFCVAMWRLDVIFGWSGCLWSVNIFLPFITWAWDYLHTQVVVLSTWTELRLLLQSQHTHVRLMAVTQFFHYTVSWLFDSTCLFSLKIDWLLYVGKTTPNSIVRQMLLYHIHIVCVYDFVICF